MDRNGHFLNNKQKQEAKQKAPAIRQNLKTKIQAIPAGAMI